jgi:hypothetical protein
MTGRVQSAPGRFTKMKAKDREFLNAESGRRLESMLQRFSSVSVLVPWLRPGLSHSALRRTAARLRAGAIRVVDPRVSPVLLADVIEKSIAQEQLAKSVAMEMLAFNQMVEDFREESENERARRFVASFHRLKKSAEASDPESKVAQRVRRIHRLRRELGRGRKGKKKV